MEKKERAEIQHSRVKLKVLIAGAGVGGLSAAIALARRGHDVTVFEQAEKLAEVGAGIQVPPNSLRMLLEWGLAEFLQGWTTEPHNVYFRRWQDGKIIGRTRYIPDFREKFDAPYYVIHRAHLHHALKELAQKYGVAIKLASRIIAVDAVAGSLQTQDRNAYFGDLIVAADGIHSGLRGSIFGGQAKPSPTGFVAYRCTVNTEEMVRDSTTASLLRSPNLNLWVGEDGHVMSYPISGGNSFNVVVNRYDPSDPASWNRSDALEEMKTIISDWDAVLIKLVGMVKHTEKWPLLQVSTLQNWVCERAVILGDAAHAMLPYMSQGAAIAVEDAAALAEAIHLISAEDQVPHTLKVWETVRRLRAHEMQQASELNSVLWHFADGPEQEARDASMEAEVDGRQIIDSSANQWSDGATQRWCYAYDCEEEIRRAWMVQKQTCDDEDLDAEWRDSAYVSRATSIAAVELDR
ncbi:related to salicylate hydroxylase [Lecanosticta acicola]|uniref:Related to salicylate hydroxylase n=1 Tax=Lecanosticta acicola TaxID=111012 RepID=A0AAI8YVS6_9PEZI|nr:related to salicylate hydroxylase [Lecanosticta acicola]